MTEKSEALRLAEYLDLPHIGQHKSADELRRLHAVNQELLEALKQHGAHHGNCDYMILLTSLPPMRKPCSCGLHAAIAKATEEPK